MAESKNNFFKTFTWNVKCVDVDYNIDRSRYLGVTAHLDILGTPGSTASAMELHRDLQRRLGGAPASVPEIKNVIFNDPATIVFWTDNTKTVVKVQDGDEFDPEKGLAMAIVKRMNGNTGKYCEIFKKWIPWDKVEIDYPEIPSISYEEAIEKIQKAANASTMSMNEVLNSLYDKRRNELAEKKEVKARAEKLEKETGWIATADRMPDKSGDYLVFDPFTGSSYVYEFSVDSILDASYWKNNITLWMPVPAIPNKKG